MDERTREIWTFEDHDLESAGIDPSAVSDDQFGDIADSVADKLTALMDSWVVAAAQDLGIACP